MSELQEYLLSVSTVALHGALSDDREALAVARMIKEAAPVTIARLTADLGLRHFGPDAAQSDRCGKLMEAA